MGYDSLHKAMTTSRSSANWEAYRSWINSKISKLKDFGYDLSERNFHFGFVPLMELRKLRNAQLGLPTPEIKEVFQEVEVESGHL